MSVKTKIYQEFQFLAWPWATQLLTGLASYFQPVFAHALMEIG